MSVCLGRCVRFKLQYVQCAKWAEHMLLHCNIMFGHLGHVDHTVREGGVGKEKRDHRGWRRKCRRWPGTLLGCSRAGGEEINFQSTPVNSEALDTIGALLPIYQHILSWKYNCIVCLFVCPIAFRRRVSWYGGRIDKQKKIASSKGFIGLATGHRSMQTHGKRSKKQIREVRSHIGQPHSLLRNWLALF